MTFHRTTPKLVLSWVGARLPFEEKASYVRTRRHAQKHVAHGKKMVLLIRVVLNDRYLILVFLKLLTENQKEEFLDHNELLV